MLKFIIIICLLPVILLSESKIDDILKENNIDAQMQLLYYSIDKTNNDNDAYATALGGYLKYTTDSYHNIFSSIRFNTSNPIGTNHNKIKTSMFNNNKNGASLNVNSEFYIAYRTSSGVIKVGNMILNTPMMNEDTTRIVPWSYQGITYTDNITKDLKAQLYHINAIRSNTSNQYKKESASGEIGDSGVTLFALKYTGIPTTHIQSYYYYAPELYSTFVGQIDYDYISNFNKLICFGLQYFKSSDGGKYVDSNSKYGGDDIDLIALRMMLYFKDLEVSLNYSQNYGESGAIKGYGGLAKVYTSSMIANGRGNFKPETWMIKSTYDLPFSSYDSEVAIRLTKTKFHEIEGDDFLAYYLHFKHFFNTNTSLYLRYENINYSTNKNNAQYFRAIAKYQF